MVPMPSHTRVISSVLAGEGSRSITVTSSRNTESVVTPTDASSGLLILPRVNLVALDSATWMTSLAWVGVNLATPPDHVEVENRHPKLTFSNTRLRCS